MSLRKVTPDDTETFSVETHPVRTYFSSSRSGPTGSVRVFPVRSDVEKDLGAVAFYQRRSFLDTDLDQIRTQAFQEATGSSKSNKGTLLRYLGSVRSQPESVRKSQTVEVLRITPPTELNSDTLRKAVVTETLFPFYRAESGPTMDFSYANYNSLCFFTASGYATDASVLYPNPRRPGSSTLSDYGTTGSFSFDFWINPRFTTDGPDGSNSWKAGTIVHLTSSYALSLMTGSLRDENGFPKGFRLLLQLSESADVAPSIAFGTFILSGASANPQTRFIFASEDNSLLRNQWHHVTVRWGGPSYNNGSGSFVVDQVPRGTWVCTQSMVLGDYLGFVREPSVLVLGNYYQGVNSGSSALTRWFANLTAEREGLLELDTTPDVVSPAAYAFAHPLNAEIHDLKFYDRYLTDDDVSALQVTGPTLGADPALRWWVPPFFTAESPTRQAINNEGGVLVTPFQVRNGSLDTSWNPWLAFTCGGHYPSLDNHLRDLVTGRYPRTHALTASALGDTSQTLTANQFLYATGSNHKRLYLVLPCDNGSYTPRFDALDGLSQVRFVTDTGVQTRGVVTLRNVFSGSYGFSRGLVAPSGSLIDALLGPTPESPTGTLTGDGLAVLHRTRDNTSNQVVLFDISNLFYGTKIRPGTLVLRDPVLSGSGGRLGMTIRDNGQGNLYRADSVGGDHATWSSVGNVFYNEGLVFLKNPALYFFGSTQWDMEFEGTHNVHVLRFNLVAKAGQVTTSSNTTYSPHLSASVYANDTDQRYVWLTSILLHDDNLNVVMRTNIAQPVQKRVSDRLMFRPKIDF